MKTAQLKPSKARLLPVEWRQGHIQKTVVLQNLLTEAQIQALAKLLLLAHKPLERALLLNLYLDNLQDQLERLGCDPAWLAFVLLNSPDIDQARARLNQGNQI